MLQSAISKSQMKSTSVLNSSHTMEYRVHILNPNINSTLHTPPNNLLAKDAIIAGSMPETLPPYWCTPRLLAVNPNGFICHTCTPVSARLTAPGSAGTTRPNITQVISPSSCEAQSLRFKVGSHSMSAVDMQAHQSATLTVLSER